MCRIHWTGVQRKVAGTISSTEAEFYAAVESGKLAIYQRSILHELGMPQEQPTPIYIDNQAVFDIANVGRPIPRMCHVDTQCFAIQQWHEEGHIVILQML